jgi:hypothetical protein
MTAFAPSTLHRPSALRRQEGFTMIIALGVMLVTSALLVAVFTAANGEIHLTSTDTAAKKAYYAAQAGINDYEYHLTQDGNYLSYCTEPPSANPALNQVGETSHRATIPPAPNGEPSNEQYAIQLLPAESAPAGDRKCDPNNLVESMLEEKAGGPVGTFRIESTGYSGSEKRTIVATFRNANFVSYVWYTKYETGDPAIYGEPPKGLPNYYTECANFYGVRPADGGSPRRCINNFFINGESVNGPMHTEDHAGVCGSPTFGRNENDRIEFGHKSGIDEGYSSELLSCGGATPTFKGNHIPVEKVLSIEPPPGDEELKHIVEPAYLYKEKTEIVLEGSTMTVIEHKGAGATGNPETEEKTKTGVAFPPNGVIYIAGGCSVPYSPFGPNPNYTGTESDTACGNVYVHGEYTSSLTIASENDIIINGNITTPNSGGVPTSNALLGLIANNFVRIYHPVVETYEGHGPELEAALHKQTVKVTAKTAALAKELKVEVKESGTEYEVLVLNAKSEVLEKTALLKEASQLIALTSPYVVYAKGAKYSEGETEKLKPLAAKGLNETCNNTDKYNSILKGCEYTDTAAGCDAPNSGLDLTEPTIYAAMLAVKHAVIVDNYNCGTPTLKNLKVYGAVAGLFTNGFTGQFSGSSIIHGYPYNANYDNRLQVEEPPHFLNPIQAAWYVQRQTLAPSP